MSTVRKTGVTPARRGSLSHVMRHLRARFLSHMPSYLVGYLAAVVIAFPFYWTVATSLKGQAEVYLREPTLIPATLTFEPYVNLLTKSPYMTNFINSTKVSIATTAIVLFLAISAGFSLGRLHYPGRKWLVRTMVLFYVFPGVLLLVPLYLLMAKLSLIDNLLALVIVYTTFQVPYATLLLRSYFMSIPREIEEAALVDGATRLRTIATIIIPLARPGIAVAGIMTFMRSWSEFIMASMLMVSSGNKTLPVGLYELMGTYHIEWGLMSAGAVVTAIPILVLYAVVSRSMIRGLTGGALKG